jgi:uncharacterized protein (TIGR00297 family)
LAAAHSPVAQTRTPAVGRLVAGLGYSGSVAIIGWRRHALAPSGAVGALGVGGVTYLAGAWRWSSVLLAFFASSSALSHLGRRRGATSGNVQKSVDGPQRNLKQTLANGGAGALAALAYLSYPESVLAAAFAGSIAAANADTWATEIGGASSATPRWIHTGKIAPAGMSGAVTLPGLLASVAGGLTIAMVSALSITELRNGRAVAAIAVAGFAGAVSDSIAGALIQARYRCPNCDEPTDDRTHDCGAATILDAGQAWCTNDLVNVICTTAGAVTAALLSYKRHSPRP